MLDIVILILIVSWLGGFSMHVGGGLVHLLLVIALIVFIVRLLQGRRIG
ncbi:MAG: lmo0937 family membrane protein [Elusimicrobia bacterium]|nr:lmo0937 family membrane protein [Elusimicrobiota bacterium]